MLAVVLLDQRRSRARPDLVGAWLEEIGAGATLRFALSFERTAGDEVEALIDDAQTLATVALRALEASQWWVGIGIGDVENPLPSSVRASRGPAFLLARQALEESKRGRFGGVRVLAMNRDPTNLEAALLLMKTVFDGRARTPKARAVAELLANGLSQARIAAALGTSKQNVSRQLRVARWTEERAGRGLVLDLARGLLADV